MFTAVPPHYDLINTIMTWGLDERWRRQAARECLAARPARVLDLCCGTGDLGIAIARLAKSKVELAGVDYSLPMLELASKKARSLVGQGRISYFYGDVAALPFADGCFDSIGISFAFRNLAYKNPLTRTYLAEILRVLKLGGRFVIVETSQPRSKLIRACYHLYLRGFASRVGYWLSGNRGAYNYLAESTTRFYTPEELKGMLLAAGFSEVSFRPLFLGAISIHVAIK